MSVACLDRCITHTNNRFIRNKLKTDNKQKKKIYWKRINENGQKYFRMVINKLPHRYIHTHRSTQSLGIKQVFQSHRFYLTHYTIPYLHTCNAAYKLYLCILLAFNRKIYEKKKFI